MFGVGSGSGHGRRAATSLSPILLVQLLFLGGTLRAVFATGPTLTTRTSTASLTALTALSAGPAGAALALRWPHLLQLLQLLGRQDLLDLRLHLSLQRRHLLLLIGGQVQLLLRARGHQAKPALPARTTGNTGAAFATWRRLCVGALISVLSC